jgi:hypothetical protein
VKPAIFRDMYGYRQGRSWRFVNKMEKCRRKGRDYNMQRLWHDIPRP